MNRPIATLCIAASLVCAGTLRAQTTVAPAPALRAASQPPATSPTVQAAEETRAPAEMRPEKRAVPQVSVPLKRKTTPEGAAAASRPTLDDEMARCLAQKSRHERAQCTQLSKERKPTSDKSG